MRLQRFILALLTILFLWLGHSAQAQMPADLIPSTNWWRNCASMDLDFYNNRYYLNSNSTCDGTVGTTYSSISSFLTGSGGTFTRSSGASNITASGAPFYIDATLGQSWISRAASSNTVTATSAPFYTGTGQAWASRSATTNNVTSTIAPFYTGTGQSFVSRGSAANYYNSSGVITSAASNTARTNYTYNGSSWISAGTLIEPAATNLEKYSTATASWSGKTQLTSTSGYAAPDGSTNATYLIRTAVSPTSGGAYIQEAHLSTFPVVGSVVTTSVYAQAGSNAHNLLLRFSGTYPDRVDAIFDLNAGVVAYTFRSNYTIVSTSITSVGGGWYRCSITAIVGNSTVGSIVISPTSATSGAAAEAVDSAYDDAYIWGLQVEQSSYPTSYIATSGAAASRSADVYNQEAPTYFDSSGTLNTSASNTARTNYTYNGSSWVNSGTLAEPAATNSLRNNTMIGGVTAATAGEFMTSPTFSGCSGSTCTGWTTNVNGGTGTVTFGSNTVSLLGDGTNEAAAYQAAATVIGHTYVMTFTNSGSNSVTVKAGTAAGGTTYLSTTVAAGSTYQKFFVATSGTTYIQVGVTSAVTGTMSQVSLKDVGIVPTNWSFNTNSNGLIPSIVGTGTANGINYVDVNISGTSVNGGNELSILYEATQRVAASLGQYWTFSEYMQVSAGSTTNVAALRVVLQEQNSGGSSTQADVGASLLGSLPTSGALSAYRATTTKTMSLSGVAYLLPYLSLYVNTGKTVNVTLRIGMPQLENSYYTTSVIPTSGATVTRAADVFSQEGATYFNSSGVMNTSASNTARNNYTYNGSSWVIGGGTSGTLVESASTNYATYSEQMENAAWFLSGTVAVTPDNRTAPDGTTTADDMAMTGASTNVYQTIGTTFGSGGTFTGSIYAQYVSGTAWYRVILASSPSETNGGNFWFNIQTCAAGTSTVRGTGVAVSSSTQALSGGWCRLIVTATVGSSDTNVQFGFLNQTGDANSTRADGTASFWGAQVENSTYVSSFIPTMGATASRPADVYNADVATYFDSTGTIKLSPRNTPRFDHDPTVSSYPSRGLLMEEARTNLLPYSTQFSSWSQLSGTPSVTSGSATAPDGNMTASTLSNSSSSSSSFFYSGVSPTAASGTTYVLTVYMTSNVGCTVNFGGSSQGTTVSYNTLIQTLTNGWKRYQAIFTTNTTNGTVTSQITVSPSTSCIVWGAQLETGSFPTSYIPTTGSSVQRKGESFTIPVGTWFNSTAGTFIASAIYTGNIGSPSGNPIWYMNDGTTNNWIYFGQDNTGRSSYRIYSGGSMICGRDGTPSWASGANNSSAFGLSANDYTIAFKGSTLPTCSSASSASGLTTLYVGCSNTYAWDQYVTRLTYFPVRHPDVALPEFSQ